MNDNHITEVLDNAALASLSPSELDEIRAHARDCEPCGNAFAAAQLAAFVIQERAQAVIEPSPFFQTRVMAALREQQATESVPAWLRLWNSARGLVSSMALTTAALAVFSFLTSAPATPPADQTVSALSAEAVILGQDADELTYEQVMSAIYEDVEDR
ncbi:MAG TPA: hypothetical protein VFY34_03535 [Pyrinomonadaceae bacterium]|nr:hypothetical protein [Pyrinomonadaceae bacterium]